jgi:hypothetical protein
MKELPSRGELNTRLQHPYVVSSDVAGLMERWTSHNGLQLPKNGFFKHLTNDLHETLKGYFSEGVEIVDEQELRSGLLDKVAHSYNPVISLDRAYLNEQTPNITGFIDLTRGIDENLKGIGLRERPGTASKDIQLERLRTSEITPITLVDDVIFSGEGVVEIAKDLTSVNIRVDKVIAGIGIVKGIELIQDQGIEVDTVRTYDAVIDEVCARDFYPGVPLSGRSVYTEGGNNYSAPYISPFGNPEAWANIPEEHVENFSQIGIAHAVAIWEAVEHASDRKIPAEQTPRWVRGLEDDQSIVYALRRHLR